MGNGYRLLFNLVLLIVFCILGIVYLMRYNLKLQWPANYIPLEQNLSRQFCDYMLKYNKSYSSKEYLRRQRYFQESLEEISRLNALHGSAVFGLTKFSDLSPEEKELYSLGKPLKSCTYSSRSECPGHLGDQNYSIKFTSEDLARKVDWRNKVGPVVNQKKCNGCWAFSIVGVMESMWAISGHELPSLSIQEVIDCSKYNNKCEGGDARTALEYLCMHDYPIVTEADYPLLLVDQTCKISPKNLPSGRRIASYTNKCNMNADEMLRLIWKHGPLIVAVNNRPWFNYNSGVIQRSCSNDWSSVNHIAQIVGYDLTAAIPHYIIRNSMGRDFGDDGYVRVAVHGNVCGVESSVAYVTVK